jgi:hypothetical protein
MEDEHDRIADERLQEADRVEELSDNLKRDIQDTKEDWKSKQGQEAVPGAVDPDKFYPEDEEPPPEPEYTEINPQSADASGGGQTESDDSDDDE